MRIKILANEAAGTTFSSPYGIGRGELIGAPQRVGTILDVEFLGADIPIWGIDIMGSDLQGPHISIVGGVTWVNAWVETRGHTRDWEPLLILRIGDVALQVYPDGEEDHPHRWVRLRIEDLALLRRSS